MKLLGALVEHRIACAMTQASLEEQDTESECCCSQSNASVLKTIRFASQLVKQAGFSEPDLAKINALTYLFDELSELAGHPVSYKLYASMLALDMAFESVRCDADILPEEYCRRIARRLNERQQRQYLPN